MKATSYFEALQLAGQDDDWRRCLPDGCGDAVFDEIGPAVWDGCRLAAQTRRWPLLLQGPTGTGKTYAVAVMLAVWRACGYQGLWMTWPELLADIREARRTKGGVPKLNRDGRAYVRTESFYWRALGDPQRLVVLDDFGIGQADEDTLGLLHSVLTKARGPLLLTSNLTPERMEQEQAIDHRIASRLRGGTIVEIDGADRRRGKRLRVQA